MHYNYSRVIAMDRGWVGQHRWAAMMHTLVALLWAAATASHAAPSHVLLPDGGELSWHSWGPLQAREGPSIPKAQPARRSSVPSSLARLSRRLLGNKVAV
jgi:hypothetical protein